MNPKRGRQDYRFVFSCLLAPLCRFRTKPMLTSVAARAAVREHQAICPVKEQLRRGLKGPVPKQLDLLGGGE